MRGQLCKLSFSSIGLVFIYSIKKSPIHPLIYSSGSEDVNPLACLDLGHCLVAAEPGFLLQPDATACGSPASDLHLLPTNPHLLPSVALWEGELHQPPGLSFSRGKGKTQSALPFHWPPHKQSISVVGDINIFLSSCLASPQDK